jgi:protein O-mannosyl-transferase
VDQRRRRPLYIGLAATWVVLAALVYSETRPRSVGFSLGWPWWAYLETQAAVVVHYLRMAIVPSPLVFDYGWPRAESFAAVAPQAALVVTLLILSAVAVGRRRPIGLSGAWFFLILAPTSSVLPITTEVAAEHRLYLPVAAVIVLAVIGVYELCRSKELPTSNSQT